jgi:hypothetical protein
VGADGKVQYHQEGRLGYEEYAAKGFMLWGMNPYGALAAAPFGFTEIFDIDVPRDGRDPRVFHVPDYVLTESYVLDGLELNWDLPNDRSSGPGVASLGWQAEFASRIYHVQQRRFEETGVLTARSEHNVEGEPFFVYDTVFADGYAWNTLDLNGNYLPHRAAMAGKAALAMWALWQTSYTDALFEAVAKLADPAKGISEGSYEDGRGPIPLQTANNNGVILAALLYKVQGPILRHRSDHPAVWDVAPSTAAQTSHCLPPGDATPCPCDLPKDPEPPPIAPSDYLYCEPLPKGGGTAARACAIPTPPASGSALATDRPLKGVAASVGFDR